MTHEIAALIAATTVLVLAYLAMALTVNHN